MAGTLEVKQKSGMISQMTQEMWNLLTFLSTT